MADKHIKLRDELFLELIREDPNEKYIEPRPNCLIDDEVTQGRAIFNCFRSAKRKRNRKQMLLYLYYLGELFETKETIQRNLSHHKYLTAHYLTVAIRIYQLFEEVGPEQIYRTKTITTTHILNTPVYVIEEVTTL